jgi:hypothetical protein
MLKFPSWDWKIFGPDRHVSLPDGSPRMRHPPEKGQNRICAAMDPANKKARLFGISAEATGFIHFLFFFSYTNLHSKLILTDANLSYIPCHPMMTMHFDLLIPF